MTCSDFLAGYSAYHDGDASEEQRDAFEGHLASCPSCRRYRDVVTRGVELLRSLPAPTPRHDFRPRLQHAIYHEDAERARRRSSSSLAGTGAMTLVAAVAILAGILWTPVLFEEGTAVELPPVVVNTPPATSPASREDPVPLRYSTEPASFLDSNLWAQPNTLLFEHSTLQRKREGSMVRTGLQ
jgi:anti-sigma factor RsiW